MKKISVKRVSVINGAKICTIKTNVQNSTILSTWLYALVVQVKLQIKYNLTITYSQISQTLHFNTYPHSYFSPQSKR